MKWIDLSTAGAGLRPVPYLLTYKAQVWRLALAEKIFAKATHALQMRTNGPNCSHTYSMPGFQPST